MSNSEQLGAMVRAARRRAGYPSIHAMARATGLSSGQLSEIESGKRSPSISTLERIFSAIGWEVSITFRPAKTSNRRR